MHKHIAEGAGIPSWRGDPGEWGHCLELLDLCPIS